MSTIIITGTREATDADRALVHHILDGVRDDARVVLGHRLAPITRVIHGACGLRHDLDSLSRMRGVDRLADEWAHARGIPVTRVAADWRTHGRCAGPIRNARMAAMGADLCVALPLASEPDAWGGRTYSRGTDDMILCAGRAPNGPILSIIYELQHGDDGRLRIVGGSSVPF